MKDVAHHRKFVQKKVIQSARKETNSTLVKDKPLTSVQFSNVNLKKRVPSV